MTTTCTVCAAPVDADRAFCRDCGWPVAGAAPPLGLAVAPPGGVAPQVPVAGSVTGTTLRPRFRWATAARVALITNAVLCFLLGLSASIFTESLELAVDEDGWDGFVDTVTDGRLWFLAFAQAIFLVPAAVLFLVWLAEAYDNARLLVADRLRSTFAVVGGWLIPFWVYWHSVKSLNEIARASAADAPVEIDPRAWRLRRAPALHYWWVVAFVVGTLSLTNGVSGLFTVGEAIVAGVAPADQAITAGEGIEAARTLANGQYGLGIAGLLAAKIVNKITRHQRLRLQSLAASGG